MTRNEMIPVRILLVSNEIEVIEGLCRNAQISAIHIETCCDTDIAMRKLCRGKFEGIIVDLGLYRGLDFLSKLRTLTSNKSSVSYAILSKAYERTDAFKAGANFVLEQPLVPAEVLRVFKASYPLLVRERRRYCRYPVQVTVVVSRTGAKDVNVTSLNVSENGICLNATEPLRLGDKLAMKLCLPGTNEPLQLQGEVCWSESTGRVGVQFCSSKSADVATLRSWLAEKVEEHLLRYSSEVATAGN